MTVATLSPTCKSLIADLYGDAPVTPPVDTPTAPVATPWKHAVKHISELAHAKLDTALHGRLERATALVLNDAVWFESDSTCQVRASDGVTWYLVNGSCRCEDYARAPQTLCKHRLARQLALRAGELLRGELAPEPSPLEDAPAPAPAPAIPPQHVVQIQGKPFVRFAGLLQLAHERGLVRLSADWTYNDAELSLARAVATFQDGRTFEEAGDATPSNTTRKMAIHFRRIALTRAKARCLRDALGVDLVSLEELGDD